MTKELEEELNRESAGKEDQEPTGCWASFTGFISSKLTTLTTLMPVLL